MKPTRSLAGRTSASPAPIAARTPRRARGRAFSPSSLAVLLACGLPVLSVSGAGFDQNHPRLGEVLHQFVKEAKVDYPSLKAHPAKLEAYLGQTAAVSRHEFDSWTRDNRLAFLINLYNAGTLKLIIDHYPLKSIKSIGFLPHAAWRIPVVQFLGKKLSLGALENDFIRREFTEVPEVHFALVCAALGCPPLREEPYVGKRLHDQLRDQAVRFLTTRAKNRVDQANRIVYLSPIFDWYEEDFERASGSVLAYLEQRFPEQTGRALSRGRYRIRYTRYDWNLNAQHQT